ncbi:MAG: heavy-metal-associated domain-containing protein [Chloroflexota bacterium]
MIKKTFRVPDMHCSACVMRLEGIEDELPGVKRVDASYHKQQMTVEYDENQVQLELIIAEIKKKGYEAIPL